MTCGRTYDAIVIGVGGMGSAAVYQLAKRGLRVLGLERFRVPHELGSSHGITRIIRLAFHEGPSYVPLGRRAYELWHELEERAGEQVLHITGLRPCGRSGTPQAFESTLRACVEQDVPHEVLKSAELSARFPGYGLPPEMSAVVQPQGGFLTPERCVESHVAVARGFGAEVREEEQVLDWEAFSSGVRVRTEAGVYEAGSLVLTAGAWAGRLAPELAEVAVPERQVMAWFEPDDPALFAPVPLSGLHRDDGRRRVLRVSGVRRGGAQAGQVRRHGTGSRPRCAGPDVANGGRGDAARVPAPLLPEGGRAPAAHGRLHVHQLAGQELHHREPLHVWPQVSFAAGFSGHGFKFSSVVGEIMADLAERGETRHDISLFAPSRFTS